MGSTQNNFRGGAVSRLSRRRSSVVAFVWFTLLAKSTGSEPALLAVWPLPGQKQTDVTASYRAAAEAVKGRLLRAGDAWQAARERDAALKLTVSDGFHPTPLGSHLAALAVHCALHGTLPPSDLARERERTGRPDLTDAQVSILREAACF